MAELQEEQPDLAQQVIRRLEARTTSLATCESLTGGWLGARLTAVPGASKVYRGGLITYTSDLKATLVSVDRSLILAKGVVNEVAALQMARGAQRQCDSDWAVATTGVAGPDQQDGAAVGTVWIAVVGPTIEGAGSQYAQEFHFQGDRTSIRQQSVEAALDMLLCVTSGE